MLVEGLVEAGESGRRSRCAPTSLDPTMDALAAFGKNFYRAFGLESVAGPCSLSGLLVKGAWEFGVSGRHRVWACTKTDGIERVGAGTLASGPGAEPAFFQSLSRAVATNP